ncbi:hypothetical protein ACSBR2_040034 [Camellia fascicularis]
MWIEVTPSQGTGGGASSLTDMIQTQAEHCAQPGVVPLTPKELSVKVLKPRFGYVKGLSLRPSFSIRGTIASIDAGNYVRGLEMEIQE